MLQFQGASDLKQINIEIQLTDIDVHDAVRGGITALPNVAQTESTRLPVVGDLVSAEDIVDEWESQSQADPTGFHVNLKEVNNVAVGGTGASGDEWGPA